MPERSTSNELLAFQLEQLANLKLLLQQEKEVLQQHDPEALNQLTLNKNELLIAIQAQDNEISKNSQFLQDKKNGLCNDALAAIEQELTACKELNTVNGSIIQHSQLAVERMKTSLLEKNSKSSVTYDNKGKKSGGLSSIGIKA